MCGCGQGGGMLAHYETLYGSPLHFKMQNLILKGHVPASVVIGTCHLRKSRIKLVSIGSYSTVRQRVRILNALWNTGNMPL